MSELAPDTILQNRYRILRLIGRGGMGAVYEALDQRLGRHVALKQMLVTGDSLSRAFEREARILANLDHPALPNVSDHFSESAGQFLVMQYVPGDDLATLLRQRGAPFPVERVLRWADQLLDALDYLHTHQPPIIHRDIKPLNLKLKANDAIMLLDFGLAKGYAPEMTRVTSDGSIVGYTPGFAPPEQIDGRGTDARSDLYALGATLYCLLTNTAPVDVLTRLVTVRHQPDPLRPAHELNPMVPEAVSRVLMQALALDVDDRPASAAAMRAALQAAQNATPQVVSRQAPTMIAGPGLATWEQGGSGGAVSAATIPIRHRSPWVWPALGGAAAVLALLVLFAVRAFGASGVTTPTPTAVVSRPTVTAVQVAVAITAEQATTAPRAIPTFVPSPTAPPTAAPPTPTPALLPTATSMPPTSTVPPTQPPLQAVAPLPIKVAMATASRSAAPGKDACGNPNTYGPEKAVDGQRDTAWRIDGDGTGESIQLQFAAPIKVARVGIIAGFDKIDPCDGTDRFFQGRIVRKARLNFDSGQTFDVALDRVRQIQYFDLPDVPSQQLQIIILATDPPPAKNGRDLTAISEIEVWGRP